MIHFIDNLMIYSDCFEINMIIIIFNFFQFHHFIARNNQKLQISFKYFN